MRLLYFAGLVFLIAGLAACSSGKRALERGNYDEAVRKAVNRLRSNPSNQKARQTLREGYALALQWHLDNVRQLQGSNVRFRWEGIAQHYDQLNALYNDIRRCPGGLQVVGNPNEYLNEAGDARAQAAAERYEAGMATLERGKNNRQLAREAYGHFATVEQLLPDYRDVRAKLEEARFYATLKVVVEQVAVGSRTFTFSNEFFQNKINEFLLTNRQLNQFVRFYTPQEATAEKLQRPDHIIRLQFDDFVVGQTLVAANTETVTSKDSVVVGEVKIGDTKQKVYDKVSAKLTITKKTVLSKGLLDMQIYDPNTNRVVFQNKMPGEFSWISEWGHFNGDERALTDGQKKICAFREVPPPPPQDLFVEFCKPIYGQVTDQIRRYYRNY
ncbi:MAG: hypothetical protein H7Z75_19305 [Ferruginibacter sp.]|nr:hypothetical protein [Cytophagales bacterium]